MPPGVGHSPGAKIVKEGWLHKRGLLNSTNSTQGRSQLDNWGGGSHSYINIPHN